MALKGAIAKGTSGGKGPRHPNLPPPSHLMRATAKTQPRPPNAYVQMQMVPSFFGAASRKRAIEKLGSKAKVNQGASAPPSGQLKTTWKSELAQPVPEPVPEPDVPPLLHVKISQEALPASSGLPPEAPAVHMSRALQASGLLGQASTILSDLVGDVANEVVFENDPDWEKYPEVGEAVKEAGGEELSLSLAICESRACWGVGVGGNWKKREMVAKLALCVALAPQAGAEVTDKFPDFCAFALDGVLPSAGSMSALTQSEALPAAAKRQKRGGVQDPNDSPVAANPEALPRDVPLWIRLPPDEEKPEKLESISLEEALVVCTEGNRRKGLYGQADAAIAAMVADVGTDIEYADDPNWQDFPAIGKALKAIAEKEECFTVAICSSLDLWAVGVGMRSKNRRSAAQVALAASIALSKGMSEELDQFPALAELVAEAEEAKP